MPPPVAAHRIVKDRRTKNLLRRLKPGDIALIHHADLDTIAARGLIEAQVHAVVNAAKSVSGRYPNKGPAVLIEAGIPIVDALGDTGFDEIEDGSSGWLDGNCLIASGKAFAGESLTASLLEEQLTAATQNIGTELDLFAKNTLNYLVEEKSILFDALPLPPLRTRIEGRHALIVVRGEGYKQDLALLRDYLRDARPALIAVDGGADALLEARLKPDIILGDMDSVSDEALRCGAEIIVHGYRPGDTRGAPGMARIESLGLTAHVLHAPGTSEDLAMLVADEMGARAIVAVGTHFSLEEFLDKGRNGMASTFLTRLRIGSKLVDAKGVARLTVGSRMRMREAALLTLAALSPIIAVLLISPVGRNMLRTLTVWLKWRLG